MDRNFARALKLVLAHEGGWSDHPRDPGGATMKGVTLATFRRYIDKSATKDDLRRITDEQIAQVYRRHYWNAVKGDELPSGVDYAVFDFAVNSGPGRAIRYLQAAVDTKVDGILGAGTLAAVKAKHPKAVISELCDDRMRFLQGLKTWGTFGKGWTRRVDGVEREALKMVSEPVRPEPPNTSAPEAPRVVEKTSLWAVLVRVVLKLLGK